MARRSLTRSAVVTVAALAAGSVAVGLAAPAQAERRVAEETIVVHGLALEATRAMQVGWLGCEDLYATGPLPTATIGTTAEPPVGERSTGFDLEAGRAVGSFSWVDSLADTLDAGLSVRAGADAPARGVAWVAFQAPADRRTTLVWLGRADLAAGAGEWESVDVTGLDYTWLRYDLGAQESVGATEETALDIASMTDLNGDGPGFAAAGFGCDGERFSLDALRLATLDGATTWDLEGVLTTATMTAPGQRRAAAGAPVTLQGRFVDGDGAPLVGMTAMLESIAPGADRWKVERVVTLTGEQVSVEVEPQPGATYRWRIAERPMAEGSVSEGVTLAVATDLDVAADESARRVTGTVAPGRAGTEVVLWRVDKGERTRVSRTTTGPAGRFAFDLGDRRGRYVVTVPAGVGTLAATSAALSVAAAPSPEPTEEPTEEPTSEPTAQATEEPAEPSGEPSAPVESTDPVVD